MFFIVLRENGVPRTQWPERILQAHLAWAKQTFSTGELLLSGPASEDRGGIYLLRTATAESARAILDQDPVNTEGYCSYRILDWNIQRGKEVFERS